MDSSFEQYLLMNPSSPVHSPSNHHQPASLAPDQALLLQSIENATTDDDSLLETGPSTQQPCSSSATVVDLSMGNEACQKCALNASSEKLQRELVADLRTKLTNAEEAHRLDLDALRTSHQALVDRLRETNKAQAARMKQLEQQVSTLAAEKHHLRSTLKSKEEALSLLTRHAMVNPDQPQLNSLVPEDHSHSIAEGDLRHGESHHAAANLLIPDVRADLGKLRPLGKLDLLRGMRGGVESKAVKQHHTVTLSDFAHVLLKPPDPKKSSFQLLQSRRASQAGLEPQKTQRKQTPDPDRKQMGVKENVKNTSNMKALSLARRKQLKDG